MSGCRREVTLTPGKFVRNFKSPKGPSIAPLSYPTRNFARFCYNSYSPKAM